jgi:hypothetical protein
MVRADLALNQREACAGTACNTAPEPGRQGNHPTEIAEHRQATADAATMRGKPRL